MKHKFSIFGLAILLALVFVGAASAAPPAPTNHLQLPYAVSNTVMDEDWWPITEVVAVTNVCDHPVVVRWGLRSETGFSSMASGSEELQPWQVLTQNVRDIILGAGHGVSMDEHVVYMDFVTTRGQCLVGDSFSLDTGAISGSLLYAPTGECRPCDTRAVRFIHLGSYTGDLVLKWTPRPFSGNTFKVVARDEGGNVVGEVALRGLPWTNSIPFSELIAEHGLPADFRAGTLEVECPDHTCYVGAEYYSTETDQHERAVRREEVPAWATCQPRPPTLVPRCVPVKQRVLSGDLNCLAGEPCEITVAAEGTELIKCSLDEEDEESGWSAELLEEREGYREYLVANQSPETIGDVIFSCTNPCNTDRLRISVCEELPPACVLLSVQVTGSTTVDVGDDFDFCVDVLQGTEPVSVDDSGMPADGSMTTEIEDTRFCAEGTATESGTGQVLVTNACSEIPVEVTVNPPDECAEAEPLTATIVDGTNVGTVGEEYLLEVGINGGLLPFTFTPDMLDGLSFEQLDERSFRVSGENPTEAGTGSVTVTDACGSLVIEYEIREDEPDCADCEGKITRMVLRYTGSTCASVEARIEPEQNFSDPTVFGPSEVCPNETFTLVGQSSSIPGFDGTLGTNLELFVGGGEEPDASIHTSCSVEVGPGYVAGDFTVVESESQHGGPLCPLD